MTKHSHHRPRGRPTVAGGYPHPVTVRLSRQHYAIYQLLPNASQIMRDSLESYWLRLSDLERTRLATQGIVHNVEEDNTNQGS